MSFLSSLLFFQLTHPRYQNSLRCSPQVNISHVPCPLRQITPYGDHIHCVATFGMQTYRFAELLHKMSGLQVIRLICTHLPSYSTKLSGLHVIGPICTFLQFTQSHRNKQLAMFQHMYMLVQQMWLQALNCIVRACYFKAKQTNSSPNFPPRVKLVPQLPNWPI